MLTLHETTRKRLCRGAFFALCVLPTLAVGSWIAARYWPGRHDQQQQAVSQTLRASAAFDPCSTPRPGVTRCGQLTLTPRGLQQPFATLSTLELHEQPTQHLLHAEHLELQQSQLGTLARHTLAWLSDTRAPFCTYFATATIQLTNAPPLELTDVRIQRSQRNGPQGTDEAELRITAQVVTSTPGQQPDTTAHTVALTVVQQPDQELLITLDAQQAQIPAQLLAELEPQLARFSAGTFVGAAQWKCQRGKRHQSQHVRLLRTGSVRGRLANLDFSDLLPPACRFQATGDTTVEIEQLHFNDQRLTHLEGTINVGTGQISRSLLESAEQNLACQWTRPTNESDPESQTPTPMTPTPRTDTQIDPFDQLACRFLLNESGLSLWGNFAEDGGRPIARLIIHNRQPLLMQPPKIEYPVSYWVKFVTGDAADWLPATEQAVQLASRLPRPRKRPPAPLVEMSIDPPDIPIIR